VLEEYQKIVEEQMAVLDRDMQRVSLEMDKGNHHLQWITHNFREGSQNKSLEMAYYFINNHHKIVKINQFE
jgi:hypothetical protein